ncbi:MAG: HAD family phosphatase [Breznakibacter sp.]|nr:HAD family phosphatase [Breznakibacter sp.]
MKYKLLVLDLDGTLTNSKKEMSARTKETLIKAQERGITIVLASGRPTYGIVPLAEELELAKYGGYILSFNGGTIINWKTKEVIHESVISSEKLPLLHDIAVQNEVEIISYQNENIISEAPENEYVKYEAFLNKMSIKEVKSFSEAIQFPVPKCLIVGNPEKLVLLEKEMNGIFGYEMSIYRSEPFFLELMPSNIDKAQSLQKLLLYTGNTREEMIACGDGFNDLSMIKFAGMGVAMANAQPAVKEASDFITLSNEEDGVAHVVELFLN